jgi:hypothetical protein
MMKSILFLALLSATVVNSQFVFSGQLSARSPGDDPSASGTVRVRTEGDTLFFESSLNNARDVTGVHLHLSPGGGAVDGGPLILALTNTTAANGQAPVSSNGGQPLVQNGQRTTANLLANPMLPAARAKLAELGITNNALANIGDVDRLLRAGVVYSDVHTLLRVSPNGLIRGAITTIPGGRKLLAN